MPAIPDPPFQVRTAGLVNRNQYHSTPGTREGDIMLTVFLDGRGVYRNRHGSWMVEKNMVGLVPPDDEGVLMADPDDPYVHYYCRFNGAYAMHLARQILADQGERFFPVLNVEEIAGYVRQMGHYHTRKLPAGMGRREAFLVQALTAISGRSSVQEGPPALTAAALQEYLAERLAERTDLERMARHFHVSKTSLCRAARRLLGETILTLHERMKMAWAETLLRLGTLNVGEVALRLGYEDPFYFSRVFRKHKGASPKRWALGRGAGAPAEATGLRATEDAVKL